MSYANNTNYGTGWKYPGGSLGASPTFTGVMTGGSYVGSGTDYYGWVGRSHIKSSADGIIELFNNAETGFTRLNFGGVSNSFPSIKRTTTTLEVKLADDSAYAGLVALSYAFGVLGKLSTTADGVFLLTDNAGTNFSRLMFGGSTSAFPALKRSGTSLNARLADDSANTSVLCNGIQLNGTSSSFAGFFDGGSSEAWCRRADNGSFATLVASIFQARNAAASGTGLTVGGTTQTTVGAAGAASALPALPLGYIKAFTGATAIAIPYYTQ